MIKIKFNTAIYKQKAIERAIVAYNDLACFSCKPGGPYIEVSVKDIQFKNKNQLTKEFSNYVLGMMQQ